MMYTFYIIGREGIWPDHNNLRAPILIDSKNYPQGYPRSDYREFKVIHDGGDFFIVRLVGPKNFEEAYRNAEPILAHSLEELQDLCDSWPKDGSLRAEIAEKVSETIKSGNYNTKYLMKRPSLEEIEQKNLRP